ncbi:MAG TPA: flagellar biosynthetic protein FliO [Bryobacteraceae bacterium]|nr:flagellar biosynthetic protein FliO [Bryobacteraceae bacterium]
MVQQILSVFLVLGLLGGLLWLLRNRGMAFPRGAARRKAGRHLESIARLPLTPQHSVHLVRVSDHAVLLALSPSGCTLVERVEWNTGSEMAVMEHGAGAGQ